MIVSRKKCERELFGIVLQPRVVAPEKPLVYAAVLALRRKGLQVFRAGRQQHLICNATTCRGRKVTTPELLKMAGPILSSPAELIG